MILPQIIFLIPLILGTVLVISSSSWFSLWLGMEMNVISFIPLLFYSENVSSAESAVTYFLIQAFASLLFVCAILVTNLMSLWTINSNILMTFVMMLKMGAAPFHSWVLLMTKSMPWPLMILLMSWQKINPLVILSNVFYKLEMFIIINSIVGAVSGLTQLSLRKMMVYSSLVHSSWVFLAMKISLFKWVAYFAGYCLNSIILMSLFYAWNVSFIKDMFNHKKDESQSTCLSLCIMNLAGLPPFLGFYLKWMVLTKASFIMPSLSVTVLMSSLTSLWFYLRIMYSAMLLSKNSINLSLSKITLNMIIVLMMSGPLFISLS